MSRKYINYLFLVVALLTFLSCSAQPRVTVEYNGEKAVLKSEHPRLILTEDRLEELKEMSQTDTLLQRYISDVIATTDSEYMSLPALERIVGLRDMLSISRAQLQRIYYLGFAWRWTGDEKYALEAKRHLLAVCDFIDWHPRHFLDVAEMTHAVSIGYDWLFDWLDSESKEIIRKAIIEKGCEEGLKVYASEGGFDKRVNNWNQVCNNSMIIGALAVGETDPIYLQTLVPQALNSLPVAMPSFDPDGVCVEGPSYWHYAVRYCAYGCASMMSALGTDFGVSEDYPGFHKTGYFPIVMTGPAGYMLAFSDCKMKVKRSYLPPMFWLAKRFSNPDFSESEHNLLADRKAEVFHVLYYTPRVPGWTSSDKLDIYMDSKVEVACMRSGWDKDALFVGMKGGTTNVSHVHLDMGNFELDALGKRWLVDLGSDSYNLPGFFDFKKQRWDYYRCVTRSHNLPVFNGKEQCLNSQVKFSNVSINTDSPFITVDLQNAYRDQCSYMERGLRMVEGRKAVLVQDEFTLMEPGAVNWGVMTDAQITNNGRTACLEIEGEKVVVSILSPANATFTVESAYQEPPQASNEGVNRLSIVLKNQTSGRIAVLFSPMIDKDYIKDYEIVPIKDWK